MSRLQPAGFDKLVPQPVPCAAAKEGGIGGEAQLLHSRRHRDDFEDGAWGIGPLRPTTKQGAIGVGVEGGPGLLVNPGSEETGVETRVTRHSQHKAGIGIEGHDGSRSLAQDALGVGLQGFVNRQIDATAGPGNGFGHLAHFLVMLIQGHQAPAAPAGQVGLAPALDADLPYHLVAPVAACLPGLQMIGRDGPQITDQMCPQIAALIHPHCTLPARHAHQSR